MAKRKPKREIPLTTFRDDATGVEIAVHSNDRPTREALRHDTFDRGWQVDKEIGHGYRRVCSLTKMHRSGAITEAQLDAALRFRTTFERAQLHGIKSRAFDPTPRSQNRIGGNMANSVMYARDRVAHAIDALGGMGSPVAEVAWWVVGLGLGVEEYATRARWNGKGLSAPVVSGLVIGAVSLLETLRRSREAAPEDRRISP